MKTPVAVIMLFMLFMLAAAPAMAQDPAALGRACIDESSEQELAESRRLRDQSPESLAAIAGQHPRALLVAPMVLVARGQPAAALREYTAIIERLSAESDARKTFEARRAELARHVEIAETGASRYATAGFHYTGEIGGIIGRDGESWLAVTWQQLACGHDSTPENGRLEVFRVENGQLKSSFVTEGAGLHPEPDGLVINGPGRDPVIAIRDFNGGNCWGCYPLRMFTLGPDGAREEGLPPGAPGVLSQMRDIDGDGTVEFIAIDTRWEFWRGLCHACSPGVFAIYRRDSNRFVEACVDFPDYYEEQVERFARDTKAESELQLAAGAIVSVFLNLAQSGRAEEGMKVLRALLDPARYDSNKDAEWARASLAELTSRYAESRKQPARKCPVNAM